MAKFWHFCFIILKLSGLAPMSWLKNPSNTNFFEVSSNGMIYNVVLLSLSMISHLYFIFGGIVEETSNADVGFALANFVVLVSFSICSITIFTFILKQGLATDVCNQLCRIHQLIRIFNEDYRKKKVDTKQKSVVMFAIICCCTVTTFHFLLYGFSLGDVFVFVDSTLACWIAVQYVWIIILMHGMIEVVNEQFQNFDGTKKLTISQARFRNNFSIQKIDVKKKNENDRNLALDILETINDCKNKPKEVWSTKLARLDALQHACLKISDAASKCSEFYTFVTLGCVFKTFFGILTSLYFLIKPALQNKVPLLTDYKDVYSLFWLCWDAFLLLIITTFVTKLSIEV